MRYIYDIKNKKVLLTSDLSNHFNNNHYNKDYNYNNKYTRSIGEGEENKQKHHK